MSIERKADEKSTTWKRLIFIDELSVSSAGVRLYNMVNRFYKNILIANHLTVETKTILSNFGWLIDPHLLSDLIKSSHENDLYIFNPVNFATLLLNLSSHRTLINEFLSKIHYIVLWQETINEDLSIIGYQSIYIDKDFIKSFFMRSKLNVISSHISFNSLEKLNIGHNLYDPITGYSVINNIVPLKMNHKYEIDVLFYGNLATEYSYRTDLIKKFCDFNHNGLKMEFHDNDIYGDDLDNCLKKTKIVIHISSFKDVHYIPWSKITYLQSKKIFYIIEDNDELQKHILKNIIVSFKRGDINDLYRQINYYLANEKERQVIIDKNYDYALNHLNIDVKIPQLIGGLAPP